MRKHIDISKATLEKFSFTGKKVKWAIMVPTNDGVIPLGSKGDTRRPHQDLIEALKALAPTLAKYAEEKITAGTPVTVQELTKTREKGRDGFKMKGRQKYANSHGEKVLEPPIRFKDDTDPKAKYTAAEWKLFEEAEKEIVLYIRGKSSQLDAFEQREDAGGAASGDGQATEEPELLEANKV